jgi:protein gp37
MGDKSGIEWTDATWNPTTRCDQVSPGCDNCYALTLAARLKTMGSPAYQQDGDPRTSGPGFKLSLHPDRLDQPLRWKRPRRIFVNSMSDLFHPDVPAAFIEGVWGVMAAAHQHQFQVLTKRPQRMRTWLGWEHGNGWINRQGTVQNRIDFMYARGEIETRVLSWPVLNVWLGTSIESDRYTFRANHLRETPAAIRFLSLEPLIGPLPSLDLDGIGWVIVGGESGPNHRPIEADWVRDIRDRCVAAGVPFFFKQWGGRTPKAGGRELDGRMWDEMP